MAEEDDLRRIVELAFESIEHQTTGGTKDRPEKHYYQRKPERFYPACERMFHIPTGDATKRAARWVDLVAKAAMDAHEGVPMAGRGRRDGELRRVERKKK